ncbi:MAG: hypothetical protein A3I16_09865 [Burkholderiales bacterium RIFCSPLOWO2_02_FULL_66_35]|nr:MAG: hypothetical protein A3I16_09865 [Burkholderiales bacterium RIFCSPLOWO2_02_FULL_66_35]
MNMNALTSAAKALDLTPEQMAQQADLACRLMSMALVGVPTPAEGSKVTRPVLALQALITAFSVIGDNHQDVTELASDLAYDMSMSLIDAALRREVVAKAARLASTTVTPTNQLEGATHGE